MTGVQTCALPIFLEKGTDPFHEATNLDISSLRPKLRDSILRHVSLLPEHLTDRLGGSPQSSRRPYSLFLQKGIPEHLRLVENDALRGLLATLQTTQGNWAPSLRFLSFGRYLNLFGFQRSNNQSPSHTMIGRLFRSRHLANFSVIDLRNYLIDRHQNIFPRHWPAKTILWIRKNGVVPAINLERLESRLGSCLVIDPDYRTDDFYPDDIPF